MRRLCAVNGCGRRRKEVRRRETVKKNKEKATGKSYILMATRLVQLFPELGNPKKKKDALAKIEELERFQGATLKGIAYEPPFDYFDARCRPSGAFHVITGDFVTDDAGMPIFALSPLAIHTRNLNEDSRATIVVQMPGWHGMANARVTLFGDIYPVDPERTSVARECFRQKHDSPKHHTLYANSGSSFQYFHMHTLHDIYFVGGFGTVTWIDCEDYYNATPDQITRDCEATLRMLNDTFRAPMIELFGSSLEHPLDSDHKDQDPDSVNIITIDQRGVDVRLVRG